MADAFTHVYRTKAWGGDSGEEFFSGAGSGPEFGKTYAEWVNSFVIDNEIRRIVDLGCGDFRVGRLLKTSEAVRYIGMDIVADVIAYNQARFQAANVEFRCANMIEDELPDGDLCLIRQVFQHLSNDQISTVLTRCSRYRFVLITEDVYIGPGVHPNRNKPHGWDTRVADKSGVFLDLPPFSQPVRTVLEIAEPRTKTMLRTVLLERNPRVEK